MEKLSDSRNLETIKENLEVINENIVNACIKAGRKEDEVKLLAVTKTVDIERINYAIDCGATLIGENRVQEILEKLPKLSPCALHLIGHLQSNKARKIVGKADVIESVDSLSIAKEISKQASKQGITQKILLEVNIGNEESKFGFDIEEVEERALEIAEFDSIHISGLMCVAPICEDKAHLIKIFSNMHNLFIDIGSKNVHNITMDILSMGMSGDYEEAIAGGSNLIRIGSAIFGPRLYRDKH